MGQAEQGLSWPVDDKTQRARSPRRRSSHPTGGDQGGHLPTRRHS
ncbi:hypothetical protein HMPREF9057_01398 [Actinomyces sp. oral taxon 171 str. F0337]|nr:hypothetical protein HMPREF9057_01398 [Actinomyces sp. oral taxon 171 str. F0337]